MSAAHWLQRSPFGSRDYYGAAGFCIKEAREESDPDEREMWISKARMWRDMARKARRLGK